MTKWQHGLNVHWRFRRRHPILKHIVAHALNPSRYASFWVVFGLEDKIARVGAVGIVEDHGEHIGKCVAADDMVTEVLIDRCD
jgi:hypothetical protein